MTKLDIEAVREIAEREFMVHDGRTFVGSILRLGKRTFAVFDGEDRHVITTGQLREATRSLHTRQTV